MPVLLVTYEHKTEGKNYADFFAQIKTNANGWWHYMEHVWIVNTTKSADEFARSLFPHITQADSLLVVKITSEHQGWLKKEAWEWLNSRKY